jgi:hypothetical protein
MFRWFIFLFCSLVLTACSAQTVSPAVTKIAITPSSIAITPSSTPTEMPTAPAELSATLGLSPGFKAKLKSEGIDSAVSRETDGSWTATQVILSTTIRFTHGDN